MVKKILWLGMALLCLALTASVRYGARQRRERLRLESNQQALLEQNSRYRVRDSLNAASVRVLTLRTDEFKRGFAELGSLVRDMGIRLKRIENISSSSIQSAYDIKAPVVDTALVRRDTVVQSRLIRYASPYIRLDGVVDGSVFRGTIETYDTLTQVVHRIPRRFLFIKYGTKELRQEIVSSNPHTRITYSRSVVVK